MDDNMDDKFKKLLKEGKEEFEEYSNETHFEASSFVEEILPLLGDYFVGDFKLDGNGIICTFANGQIIRLSATEIINAD